MCHVATGGVVPLKQDRDWPDLIILFQFTLRGICGHRVHACHQSAPEPLFLALHSDFGREGFRGRIADHI